MIEVSFVILSYNRKDDLKESLKRIYTQKFKNFEIIVCDNNSTDGTIDMIKTDFPEVKPIEHKKNLGVGAINKGFEIAKGKYIVILDDDSFPKEDSIEKMIKLFKSDNKIGVIAFNVKNHSSLNNKEINNTNETRFNYLMGFNGAGVGIRKDVIDKVGGYPEEFFLYLNENDLAIRILNQGYKIIQSSDIIAYHKNSPTNRTSKRGPFYYSRNLYYIYWKYYPFPSSFIKTLKLVCLCLYYSLEQRTFIYISSTINAFSNFFSILKKRIKIKKEILKQIRISKKIVFTMYR